MINLKSFFKKHIGNLIFLLIILGSVFLLINAENPVIGRIKAGGHSFFSIFQLGMSGVESVFTSSIKSLSELKDLREENRLLEEQLVDYKKVKNQNLELINELQKIKEQLSFLKTIPSVYDTSLEHIPAEIIAKQPGNFHTTFVLNKGAADGIRKGMPVAALYDNYLGLVGRVITIGVHSSMVIPVYSRNFYAAARFQSSYYEGLVNGNGENSRELTMFYVQKQAKSEVKYGDLVITSGMGEAFPKGLHIGTVKAIKSKAYDTSMEVVINPAVDFSRLEYVYILKTEIPEKIEIEVEEGAAGGTDGQ